MVGVDSKCGKYYILFYNYYYQCQDYSILHVVYNLCLYAVILRLPFTIFFPKTFCLFNLNTVKEIQYIIPWKKTIDYAYNYIKYIFKRKVLTS